MNHEVYKFLDYIEILDILLSHCDINFRNPDDNYSTIAMVACSMKNLEIITLIFNKDYTQNIEKKAETLKMGEVDSYGRNLLHYLLAVEDSANFVFPNSNYNAELVIMEILKFLLSNIKENKNGRNNSNPKSKSKNALANLNISSNEVIAKDKEFNTILTLSLMKGLYTVSNYLIHERKIVSPKPDGSCMIEFVLSNKNNLLHCAVLGRNLKCLNLILSLSINDDIVHKNTDELSPAELAKSIGFNYFYNVLKFHETNNSTVLKKEYLQSNLIFIDNGKVLNEVFSKNNYSESLVLLDRLKLTNSLITCSSRETVKFNTQECSINWNILLCKYLMYNKSSLYNINTKCETDIKPERILNKYVSESNQEDDFNSFIDYFNNKLPLALDENDPESYNKSILLFNKLLFNYKIGNFKGCLKVAFQILNSIMNNETYSFFLYLNTTIILVEIFINHNLVFLASILIEKLENYLNLKFKEKHNEFMDENISTYLFKAEYLHNSRDKWNDIFALIELIKAYRDTLSCYHELQLDSNTCIDYFNNYEKIEISIKSDKSDKKPIYNSLKIISESIKAKIAYLDAFLHYVEFNSITNEMNNRITEPIYIKNKKDDKYNVFINQFPLNTSVCREYRLYYLNSHGIVLLKQKKYNLAETYFQSAITFFNKSNFSNVELKDYSFALKLQHLYSIKYNLGLTYFYQKRFKEANIIFKNLSESKNSQMVRNIFLWYRIGMCYLEIFKENNTTKNNDDFVQNKEKICNYLGKDNEPLYETFLNWPYQFILKTEQENLSSEDSDLLKEAIAAFKQIIIFINTDVFSDFHLNGKMISNIYSLYTQNATNKITDLMKLINSNFKSKAHVEIIVNSYLSIIFSLLCLKQWNEVLFYIEKFKISEQFQVYYSQYKTIDSRLNMYKIVALINIKQYNLAKNLILTVINSKTYSLSEELQEFKNVSKFSNSFTQKEISYHISILVNFAKLNYTQGKFEDGDKVLNAIINKLYILRVPEVDYPIFVINLILFSLLHRGLTSLVIKIVKYRKIFEVLQEVKLLKNNK